MKKMFLQLGLFVTLSSGLLFTACNSGPKDSDIQDSFIDKASNNPALLNVKATVASGVVTLTGDCPDASCSSAAEQAAREIKGVKNVVNNITVAPAPAPVVVNDDAALKQSAQEAVKGYKDVSVDVMNGEVTLRGSAKRDDVQKIMMAVNGLNPKKVNNQLTIK